MKILVLNTGSSTQKSCLYHLHLDHLADHPTPLWQGSIDWSMHVLKVKTPDATLQQSIPFQQSITTQQEGLLQLLSTLWQGKTKVIDSIHQLDGIGHRIVHGGRHYRQSIGITSDVKAAIAELSAFAPLHNPASLLGIETIEKIGREQACSVPQVAVFDTAFHSQMPPTSTLYPLPYACYEQGIQRYGFHGISYQYVAQRASELLQQSTPRLIICHLGNGCSLSAIRDGQSIATTMGMTPLDGLMMGTRCGAIDPSILIYLLRQGYSIDQLDHMLNYESGLLGISGLSSDMRQILDAVAQGNPRAQLAFDLFIDRLRSHIAALLPTLGGLDALVFTAGIGEHSTAVRASVCDGFEFLGWQLDRQQNNRSPVDQDIATKDSAVRILVIRTEEDLAIAREVMSVLERSPYQLP